jgi:hypothetical protein
MSEQRTVHRRPREAEERRADQCAVGHDAFQFKFDFWQSPIGAQDRRVTRIMTTPDLAMELSLALRQSLRDHARRVSPVDDGSRARVLRTVRDSHFRGDKENE